MKRKRRRLKKQVISSFVAMMVAAILWCNPMLTHSEGYDWVDVILAVSGGDASDDSVSGGNAGGSVSGGDATEDPTGGEGTDSGSGDTSGSVSGGDAGGNGGSVSGGDAGGNGGSVSGGDAGGDNGNTGDEGGNAGDDSGNPGDEGGNAGDNSGNTGDEGGNAGDDSGNTGNEGGNTDADISYEEIPEQEIEDALANENIGEEVKVNTESGELTLIKDALIAINQTAEQLLNSLVATEEVAGALEQLKNSVDTLTTAVVKAIGAIDIDISTVYRNAETGEVYTGDANYGEKPVTQLAEGKTLTFTIKVPAAHYKENARYSVARCHENEDGSMSVDVLDTKQEGDTLTFSSDKFSTFILVMTEEVADSKPSENPDNTQTPTVEEDEEEESTTEEPQMVLTNITYTVQRGDNMSKIAAAHGITLARLIELNPQIKDPNLIYRGQVLVVDVKLVAAGTNAGQNVTNVAIAEYYTVVKGDCLYKIARDHNMKLNDLYALNMWVLEQKYIYAGQRIRVK